MFCNLNNTTKNSQKKKKSPFGEKTEYILLNNDNFDDAIKCQPE